jgi:hypothetical protein
LNRGHNRSPTSRKSLRIERALWSLSAIETRSSSGTLEAKLLELEGKAGIPARFVTTKALATSREQTLGPAGTAELMRAIVNGSTRIVEDRFASDIAERQRRQADAMKSLVATFMATAGVGSPDRSED